MNYCTTQYQKCRLCGGLSDDGGGLLVKHSGDPDSKSYLLWFCLDCLDDRLSEVMAIEKKTIREENLVKLL